MISNDPGRAADELAQWAAGLEEKAQKYAALGEQMQAATATATSSDGRVSVTVDGNGVPTEFGLTDRALAADLMKCMRQAQASLRRDVEGMVHDAVGDDAPGANLVEQYAQRFPDVEEDGGEPEPGGPSGRRSDRVDNDDDDDDEGWADRSIYQR